MDKYPHFLTLDPHAVSSILCTNRESLPTTTRASTQGSIGSGWGPKKDKTRRGWTDKEEEVLLASLRELVAKGWKSDNGFRAGYVGKHEALMKKEFPHTDLKGNPYINSRLTTWKRNYASLLSILNRSGVGFNVNGDFKVEADDEQWEQIYMSDNNAPKIRDKSWPLFEGWKEVFGKDRATGEGAEDIMDAVNEMMNENVDDFMMNADEEVDELQSDQHTENDDTSTGQSNKGVADKVDRKRKNKLNPNVDKMCSLLEKIHRDTNIRLESLANRFGFPADLNTARKEVFNLISRVPDLSLKQTFKACDKLLAMPERLEFFMNLPEVACQDYVFHLVTEDDKSS